MPRFYKAAEQIIARDVGRLIIGPIRDGSPIRLGAWDLYADQIYRPDLPEGSAAIDHLILLSVVGAEVGEDGVTRQFVAARRVDMWLSEATPEETGTGEWGTSVQLAFTEPVGLVPGPRCELLHRYARDRAAHLALELRRRPEAADIP